MSMSKRTTDFALVAAGAGLWFIRAKTFADHHEALSTGTLDSFQHKHATAIGTVTTLTGLGLAVYGTYRVNKTWGKVLGAALGRVIAWNIYKHKQGEPLISLSPFSLPFTHHVGAPG